MNRKIYVYTTETYKAKNWYKIGQTSQITEERVRQQDGTSCPEPLILLAEWDSPTITDKAFHRFLEKSGIQPTRQDARREWYEVPGGLEQIKTLYNEMFNGVARPNSYSMRPEQQEGCNKAVSFYHNGGEHFLFAAVMRYGKCFTSLEICRNLGYKRILLLTHKPQVSDSWKEDIRDHVNYPEWAAAAARDPDTSQLYNAHPGTLFVYESFQEIMNKKGKKKVEWIFSQHWDLIILDEEHYGTKTDNSQAILSQFPDDQRYLSLSGTPFVSLASGKFDDDSTYRWTYTEEAHVRLAEKEGGWVTDTHRCLPELRFFGIDISSQVIDKFESKGFVGDDGFNIKKIWATNSFGGFLYPTQVSRLLDALADPGDVGKTCLSPYNMDELGEDNLKLVDHSFWYLPPDVKAIAALERMLKQHYFFGDYVIINASGGNVKDIKKAKSIIKHRNKTITLSCGRFNTGVTVPPWGSVFMFDGGKSAADYWQTICRNKTPWAMKTDEVTGKVTQWQEIANVFDFDPHRMNQVIYDNCVGTKSARETTEDSLKSFCKVASITHLGEFKTIKVDADHLLEAAASRGRGLGAFGSARAVNPFTISEDLVQIFGNLSKGAARKLVHHLGDTKLQKGKISTTTSQNKKAANKENQKKIKDLQQKLQQAVSRIPTYLMIDYDKQINSCDDLVLTGDHNLFESVTGYTLQNFKDALQIGCIRQDWIDSSIIDMNLRINKISLNDFLDGNNNIFSVLGAFERDAKTETPGTPAKLVFKMLDLLPRDKWSNPHETFFDPACSTGTILLEVFRRLYNGLEEVFKDPTERIEHILTRQIYGNEETTVPYRMARAAFGVLLGNQFNINDMNFSSYNILHLLLEAPTGNTHNLPSLEEGLDMTKKYDVTVMNPPYNKPVHKDGRTGGYGGRTLWDKFLELGIDKLTKDGGYLVSVNPAAWRKPESPRSPSLFKKLTHENHMTHLSIHSKKDGQETFGASTRYDYFCVQKTKVIGNTLVSDEAHNLQHLSLPDFSWLPNYALSIFKDLVATKAEDTCEVIYSRSAYGNDKKHLRKQKDTVFCHPVVHSMIIAGPCYLYSSTNSQGHFGVSKVILSLNEKQQCPINDYEGKYGMSNIAFGIPINSKEDGDKLIDFINSEAGKTLIAASKWSTFQTEWRMFTYFKEGFWRNP
mgnify:CR=1 FL=1